MEQRIEEFTAKKMVGVHLEISLASDQSAQLWRSFMPRRNELKNTIGASLYSLQVLPSGYYADFSPERQFTKWALKEVSSFEEIPEGMQKFELPSGLYAVFIHVGAASDGPKIFRYIFAEWMPASPYELDDRPHFEVMDENYRPADHTAREEIWIPVRRK